MQGPPPRGAGTATGGGIALLKDAVLNRCDALGLDVSLAEGLTPEALGDWAGGDAEIEDCWHLIIRVVGAMNKSNYSLVEIGRRFVRGEVDDMTRDEEWRNGMAAVALEQLVGPPPMVLEVEDGRFSIEGDREFARVVARVGDELTDPAFFGLWAAAEGFPLAPLIDGYLVHYSRLRAVKTAKGRRDMQPKERGIVPQQAGRPGIYYGDTTPPEVLPRLAGVVAVADGPGNLPLFPYAPREQAPIVKLVDRLVGEDGNTKPGSANIASRIFLEMLVSHPTVLRDGGRHAMVYEVRDIVGNWLGWKLESYKPSLESSGGALRRALERLNTAVIDLPKGGFWLPLVVWGMDEVGLNGQIFTEQLTPPGGDVGPGVNRRVIRALGNRGAAWRAYLNLCCDWDYRAGHKGKLVAPKRPKMLRNPAGELIGRDGTVVKKKGRPVKSNHHPKAVLAGGDEDNPHRRKYREYETAEELVYLCYNEAAVPTGRLWEYANRAVKALEYLEQIRAVVIERMNPPGPRNKLGLPWRIMPGPAHGVFEPLE